MRTILSALALAAAALVVVPVGAVAQPPEPDVRAVATAGGPRPVGGGQGGRRGPGAGRKAGRACGQTPRRVRLGP
ncbi:hypothetical protein NCCP2495_11860 [Dietzia sp. NCCP-2495]|uniref:hypothetical protein n=1 Tax=Dietzia sp. NCCP-2495 TaxID=2934675 RepID=UPI00222FBB41|nr:hypothetical protein [Dietzia sp. NCCP-2495]GLB63308.1 hypothetical protein NCCP2495_11860 [Dietzia sp. NCCP-2495]